MFYKEIFSLRPHQRFLLLHFKSKLKIIYVIQGIVLFAFNWRFQVHYHPLLDELYRPSLDTSVNQLPKQMT